VDGFTTLLATVVSVDPIHAYAAVDEAALLRFRQLERDGKLPHTAEGKIAIELTLADNRERIFPGFIEHFDNRLDPGTGSILLRSVLANPSGELVPGLFARVRVPSSAREPVLLVSETALGTEQSLKFVYTLSPSNTVQKAFVTLGASLDGMRIVKSGLQATDRVVVNGLQRILFPGMPVQVQK
jgi:RND family efflux transporter MFP subunit